MELKLPTAVVGHADVARLLRELNALDDFFVGAEARRPGSPQAAPPRITRSLDQLARDNGLNLLESADRQNLLAVLKQLLDQAPRLHISFASEPSVPVLERILVWARTNIHPQTLLQIGLQPTIAAGCIVRTPNKVFDMSLRANLEKQVDYMVQLIQGATSGD